LPNEEIGMVLEKWPKFYFIIRLFKTFTLTIRKKVREPSSILKAEIKLPNKIAG